MIAKEETILVVDDEEPVRGLLQRILQEAGYQVVTAANGKEALSLLSGRKIDVALIDIKMPEMSGIELLRKLKIASPDICPIMVTAVVDMDTAVNVMKSGAYDYITKSFTKADLVAKVGGAIWKWKPIMQEWHRYMELSQNILNKTQTLQNRFGELIQTLAREHKLMIQLANKRGNEGEAMLSRLPEELREPLDTVEECRDAVLRILRRTE